jgi:hypothetical protein
MSHTIFIRISAELATWLEDTTDKAGVSQGEILREQLEKARTTAANQRFMRFA